MAGNDSLPVAYHCLSCKFNLMLIAAESVPHKQCWNLVLNEQQTDLIIRRKCCNTNFSEIC